MTQARALPRRAMAVAAACAAAFLGLSMGSMAAGGGTRWACDPSSIALALSTPAAGGGSRTPDEAVLAEARFLSADGVADAAQISAAMASREGSDRFDPDTGSIIIEGELVAQVGVTQLQDGTWVVVSTRYCSPPPAVEHPSGATPTTSEAER